MHFWRSRTYYTLGHFSVPLSPSAFDLLPLTGGHSVQLSDNIFSLLVASSTRAPVAVDHDGLPVEYNHLKQDIPWTILNIRTPEKFAVITLKFEQCGSTIEQWVQKDADGITNSVDLDETAPDLCLQCLPGHICPKTNDSQISVWPTTL